MTKEEIALQKYPVVIKPTGKTIAGGVYNEDINYKRRKHFIEGLEYAYQETEKLKDELYVKSKMLDNANNMMDYLQKQLNELKEEIAILKAEKRIAFDLGYKTATSEAIAEISKNYKPND